MTPFQTLSFSGGSGISIQGTGSALAQFARGLLGDNKIGHPVFLCEDSCCFVCFKKEERLFPQHNAVGHEFFFEHQPDLLGRLIARGLLHECVCVMPSFLHVTSTYWKHASVTSLLDLLLVSISTFLEGMLASPDFGQVGGSSGSDNALFSIKFPGPNLQRLDVRLRMR
jgi:hypothetical protein